MYAKRWMVRETYYLNWWDQSSVTYLIERHENLQGTAECTIGNILLVLIQS